MCGIAGWVDFSSVQPQRELLETMTRAIRHRGPDGEGFYEQGPVHLGHRRLSVIDLEGSSQPLSNEDGTIWITFNGEIFNFQELRTRLLQKGHQCRTVGDTETVVHAYEEYGTDCVQHLRGQFAFAIWDQKQQLLFMARDRMGQLPLYYSQSAHGVVFGSELKSLLKHPAVSRKISLAAIDNYLAYRYIPEPETIYQDVKQLRPACWMTVSANSTRTESYWQPPFTGDLNLPEQEALDELDQRLSEAVKLRMISDVPLGAFLSGGIDSSLVVGYMSRHSQRPVKTFTIGFDEESHDERDYALQVSRKFGTEHHPFVVRPNAIDVLPKMVQSFDQPFADSSALAVYYLAQLTREHVTVALNGDGGDESFAGYSRYLGVVQFDRYRRLPKLMRTASQAVASGLSRSGLGRLRPIRRLKNWTQFADRSLAEIYERSVTIPSLNRRRILSVEIQNLMLPGSDLGKMALAFEASPSASIINSLMWSDQQVYLPGDLLVKVDRMAMSHSLECRSPFLDHPLVEFAARLNPACKFPGNRLKHLLKKLLLRDFPADFVHRRKMGFGVPIAAWFRGQLKDWTAGILDQSRLVRDGYCDRVGVDRVFQEHLAGRANHDSQLWSLLNLELWYESVYLAV